MAFNPFAGVNARLFSAPIAVVNTTDLVTPLGSETKTSMAELVTWKVNRPRQGAKILVAGCPADAQGNVYHRRLRGGVVEPTIDIEGTYNGDATAGASSDSRFTVGGFIVVNLLFHAVGLLGYYSFVCCVADFSVTTKIGPDDARFNCKLEVDGVLPLPSTS